MEANEEQDSRRAEDGTRDGALLSPSSIAREAAAFAAAALVLALWLGVLAALPPPWGAGSGSTLDDVISRLWPVRAELDWDPLALLVALVALPATFFVSSVLANGARLVSAWQDAAFEMAQNLLFGASVFAGVGAWMLVPLVSHRVSPVAGVMLCAGAAFLAGVLMVFSRSQRGLARRREQLRRDVRSLAGRCEGLRVDSRHWRGWGFICWLLVGPMLIVNVFVLGFQATGNPLGEILQILSWILVATFIGLGIHRVSVLVNAGALGRWGWLTVVPVIVVMALTLVLANSPHLYIADGPGDRVWFVVTGSALGVWPHLLLKTWDSLQGRFGRIVMVATVLALALLGYMVLFIALWGWLRRPAYELWPTALDWSYMVVVSLVAAWLPIEVWWLLRHTVARARLRNLQRALRDAKRARDQVSTHLRSFSPVDLGG